MAMTLLQTIGSLTFSARQARSHRTSQANYLNFIILVTSSSSSLFVSVVLNLAMAHRHHGAMMMAVVMMVMMVVSAQATTASAMKRTRTASPPPPPQELDCAVRGLAFEYGATKLGSAGLPLAGTRTAALASLRAALRLQNCPSPSSSSSSSSFAQFDHQPHLPTTSRQEGAAFYVALDGSDTNPGTIERPFRTLERAREVIRSLPINERPPTTVYLRQGTYYLPRPFLLEYEDSGTASAPITYSSYAGEHVMLSGGVHLTDLAWKPYKSGIYVASIDPRRHPGLSEPFTSLFVNGQRQVRARFPNGNPQDNSGLCFTSSQVPSESCSGFVAVLNGTDDQIPCPPTINVNVDVPRRGGEIYGDDHWPNFHYQIAQPPFKAPGFGSVFSFWNNPYSRPAHFGYNPATWTNNTWSRVNRAVVHMFHENLWGNWMFHVGSVDTSKHQVHFSSGGWQEARGGGTTQGQHYFIENVLEELDTPGEWYLDYPDDPASGPWLLYYYPNSTGSDWQSAIVIPQLESVVQIQGHVSLAVEHIRLVGLQFGHTITTYLHPYEVPSGGDWSIHRGGTVFVDNAQSISIEHCLFDQTGGNALFLSNHVKNTLVAYNEFRATGDSAIALDGSSQMIDGTADTYPSRITIANNHMHDIGVYGKQTSCFIQSIASHNTIVDNVCYNGPRAGFNFNDGFGGGNKASGNLIFNMVRETEDHGPVNSWDRQPYITAVSRTAGPSIIPDTSFLTRNFVINGYSGVWTLDHDDGSAYYHDVANFLVYGGCKNYLGHDKICAGNVIVYPSLSAGNRRCVTDDSGEFARQYYYGNKCYEPDGDFYSWANCNVSNLESTVYHTWDNEFYSTTGSFVSICGSKQLNLTEWQSLRQDAGSSVGKIPRVADIITAGRNVLQY